MLLVLFQMLVIDVWLSCYFLHFWTSTKELLLEPYIINHSLVRFISLYPLFLKFKFLHFRAWNPHQTIQRRNMNASVGVATISQQVCRDIRKHVRHWILNCKEVTLFQWITKSSTGITTEMFISNTVRKNQKELLLVLI